MSEQEQADLLAAWKWERFNMGIVIVKRTDMDNLLQKRLGLSLNDFDADISRFTYLEKYDTYYGMISDSNETTICLEKGYIDENNQYVVFFIDHFQEDWVRVTLREVDGEYRFVSCFCEFATPGPLTEQEIADLQKLLRDDSEKPFLGRTMQILSGEEFLNGGIRIQYKREPNSATVYEVYLSRIDGHFLAHTPTKVE